MKKITREQAEQLFLVSSVLNTKVEQDEKELRVSMNLSGNKSCLVKFDFKNQQKTYFLENIKP
jgi:hypothetical protein